MVSAGRWRDRVDDAREAERLRLWRGFWVGLDIFVVAGLYLLARISSGCLCSLVVWLCQGLDLVVRLNLRSGMKPDSVFA